MTVEALPRGSVTFLFTDVVGSSALWARDPDMAKVAIANSSQVIRSSVRSYAGLVVKELGDGVMAVFPTAAGAVRAAVDAQRQLQSHSAGVSVRMGLHTGEVAPEGGDYVGPTPNKAARVEAAGHGGQILMTGTTWDSVGPAPDLMVHDFGLHYLRGLPDAERIVQVMADGLASDFPTPKTESRPDRPSIAVLPFATSGGQDHQEFADGLVEDLVIGLSRCHDLYVIARNSTLVYADTTLDPSTIAARLGVRYLLQGTVRWAGTRARISLQLLDGVTGGSLWVEQYDREGGDMFSVFDEITADIVAHLSGYHGVLVLAEKQRTAIQDPGSLDDYEAYMRALELKHRFTPEAALESRALLEGVLAHRPSFARAHVALAWTWLFEVWWGWTTEPETSLANAWASARTAVGLDALDAEVHWLLAELHMVERSYPQVEASYRRSIELNPSLADVRANWASTANKLGLHEEALESMELAIRLNPNHPVWYLWFKGAALFGAGKADEALAVLQLCAAHNVVSQAYLAASLEVCGQHVEAEAAVRQCQGMVPGLSCDLVALFEPYKDPSDQARLLSALEEAGLPRAASAH